MDKITYLAELAEGLARWVPERERQDILRYYAEYFEEAGPGREAEVVAELGDPWALSCRLAVEGGYVTYEKAASWTPRKTWPKILLGTAVGLSVFALVFGFGLLAFNVVRFVDNPVRSVTVSSVPMTTQWGVYELEPGGAMTEVDSEHFAFVDTVYGLEHERILEAFNSIDVDVGLGNIQVVAGDSFNLSVGWNEAMIGYEPAWEVRDGVLRIRAGSGPQVTKAFVWDDLIKLFSADQLAVDVIITVPRWAVLNRVSVKTGLGDVLLYGVCAEAVTAETGVGDVECCNIQDTMALELNTGVGGVSLILEEVRPGLNANLNSGTGNVDASLGSLEENFAYTLESGLSLVIVNGVVRGSNVERRGSMPCRLNAESGTGSVNVYFFG